MTTGKKTTGDEATSKKETFFYVGWRLGAALLAVLLSLALLSVLYPSPYPSKMDGWVFFSGGERHVGHDNAIGLCRIDDTCQEIYMGCGAVNCQCVNKTESEIDEFFSATRCGFVMGEGIVCH